MTRSKKFRLPIGGTVSIPLADGNNIHIGLQFNKQAQAPILAIATPPDFEVLQAKDARATIRNQAHRFSLQLEPIEDREDDYQNHFDPDNSEDSNESNSQQAVADLTITYSGLDN